MAVLLVELVEEVETQLSQLARLSDIVAQRKAVAINALKIERTREVPESVKTLQEIRDKAAQSANAVREIEHVPIGGVEVDPAEPPNMAFRDQTPRTIERMKLTPRSCWSFLQWGSAPHRVQHEKGDLEMDKEMWHLQHQIKVLEKEIKRRETASAA